MATVLASSGPGYRLVLLVLSILAAVSWGLQVAPGSGCASYCLDSAKDDARDPSSSTTKAADVVCANDDYWSTAKGTKFRTCLTCLQNSTFVNGTENDVAWYLYNVRYAVDVCLFSFPGADAANTSISSPCGLSNNCEPLQSALQAGSLKPGNETEFEYCSADGGAFAGEELDNCIQCLQTSPEQSYLSNFLTALSAGCQQKPAAGHLLGLNGTIFSTSTLAIVNPSWNQTAVEPAKPVTTLTTGTIVGISVGAVLLLVGAVVLFFLYWRRQKRDKNFRLSMQLARGGGPSQPMSSITSSITGNYVPFYTTDYKRPPTDQRDFEMYDKIKTQHVVMPDKKEPDSKGVLRTASLWGHDTPYLTRQQFLAGPKSPPTPQQIAQNEAMNQNLDEMPTHPAFIPRAFTRGSRIPANLPGEDASRTKSNKPDDYAIQRYLDTMEDTSKVDVASLTSPPLLTSNTTKSTTTANSNPFLNSEELSDSATNTPRSGPSPDPTGGPRLTPSLDLPSMSRARKPKRYIPPPLNIGEARPKAHRVDGQDVESGMP